MFKSYDEAAIELSGYLKENNVVVWNPHDERTACF